jgi:transposase
MTSIAERTDIVIGVDTHKQTHTAAIVTPNGGILETLTVTADPAGYMSLFEHAAAAGARRVWSIEGCGSWGRGLCRWLQEHGETVTEIERPKRPKRRAGKSDTIDAIRAAREALHLEHVNEPRDTGLRDAIAAANLARQSAVQAAGDAERQLLALANTCPEQLAGKLRGRSTRQIVTTCATWRTSTRLDPATMSIATTMRILARRASTLRDEADQLERTLKVLIDSWRPDLLAINGIGPTTAAIILTAWSHPGRIHSPAAFAKLAGTAPIEASSGQTTRHRLSPFGDRQLNRAIHIIALNRMRYDHRTITYTQRRRAEGKTNRDIRRCIKNYIARELHRTLETGLDKP